jgi:exodeoxyribonuclease-3
VRLATWNVNGIRSIAGKGFLDWVNASEHDVFCLQEVKAFEGQVAPEVRSPEGYRSYWNSAQKPGYSGVATFTKHEPLNVEMGLGVPELDQEGRVLTLQFKDFDLVNAYFPNSQHGLTRLPYKLQFCEAMFKFLEKKRKAGRNVIVCGDFNIAHREIDLKNPKSNIKNPGFLPEERAWMDHIVDRAGYIDAFRKFEKGPGHYTWWSYRPGVREKNVGWRIDYFVTNPEFEDRLVGSSISCNVMGSDHCPVLVETR